MIEILRLTKAYGALPALNGISMTVPAGEMCVILGPSGAGKSTLLRCVNRLVEPGGGEIRVNGRPAPTTRAELRELRAGIGMIFQHHNLVPRLSVLKNVLSGRLARLPLWSSVLQIFPREDIAIAMEALARVGLADRAEDRADRLSGGQQQRVGIARVLAQRPQVILADEPVASLDPVARRWFLETVLETAADGAGTVLFSTHITSDLERVASHVALLR